MDAHGVACYCGPPHEVGRVVNTSFHLVHPATHLLFIPD